MRNLLATLGLQASEGTDEGAVVHRPVPKSTISKSQYESEPSFTDLLPWAEYLPDDQAFLLEDGHSVGAVLELTPVGCEGRPSSFLEKLHEGLTGVQAVIMEIDPSPWVLQVYVQDEMDLRPVANQLEDYISPGAKGSKLSDNWVEMMRGHLHATAREGGVFEDTQVSKWSWGGKLRRTRMVIYRRTRREEKLTISLEQLRDQLGRIRASLNTAGVQSTVADGEHVYYWLLQWFNPRPDICDGDVSRLAEIAPYPGDDDVPFGRDFAEMLTLSVPRSDPDSHTWYLDDLPHTVVSVHHLRRSPEIGTITAEQTIGEQTYALFDRMPPGTVMAMTMIAKPQDILRAHVAKVKSSAVGDGAEAVLAHENAKQVERQMAKRDRLVPTYLSFYVRGEDETDLRRSVNHIESLLQQRGLHAVDRESELLGCDAWIRNLPMNYEPALDRTSRRSKLTFASHATALLPCYGRSRGTGHPGFMFWNRGGDPLTLDPLSKYDRKKNGHMLVIGPTGAGKSATLVYLILQALAVWRPRLYIIEAGNSFGLLCDYLKTQGLSVYSATMQPQSDVSLPPFAGALSLLDLDDASAIEDESPDAEIDDDDALDQNRDLLGEMEIAARIMITGGDAREEARMSRSDRMVIRQAIFDAVRAVHDAGRDQVLTEDVANALKRVGKDATKDPRRRERATDMGDAMMLFCDGIAGRFFNRPGQSWPDVDVTHLEMGILQREGYEDQLTVAYIALMNHINGVVEAQQHDSRPTVVITDEGHIITTNPLLAPYVVKITKMWRKYGAWYWIATQNLDDFPDASKRMLNMLEWWMCLVMPKEEVDQIARFRNLTEDQRQMLLSTRKETGKYTEGVVLTDSMAALFRNVPPSLVLALAQTEKEEKAARAEIMARDGCTEVEAAMEIACQIDQARSCAASEKSHG